MIRAIVPAPTLMLPTRARRRHVGACRHLVMVASASPRGLGRKGRHGSCPWQCLLLRITTTIRAEGTAVALRGDARRLGLHDARARGGDRRRRSMEHMKIPGTDLS